MQSSAGGRWHRHSHVLQSHQRRWDHAYLSVEGDLEVARHTSSTSLLRDRSMPGDNEDVARANLNHAQAGGFAEERHAKYRALCHHNHNMKLSIDSVLFCSIKY